MSPADDYAVLKNFLVATDSCARAEFFERAAEAMSGELGCDLALVARLVEEPARRVQVLGAWEAGTRKDAWAFDLAGTPCEVIYDSDFAPGAGIVVHSGRRVTVSQALHARFAATKNTDFEAFVGVPLWGTERLMIGHVALFFRSPLADKRQALTLDAADLMARRIQVELEHAMLEEHLAAANAGLARDSLIDPLTQVANRRHFTQRATEAHVRFRRTGQCYALIACDVDHFKSVNDRYGHVAGDAVLRAIADALGRNMRENFEFLARIGGEEFGVICPDVCSADDARALAERLRDAVAAMRVEAEGMIVSGVSLSIGVTVCSPGDLAWEDVYRRADHALYQAKADGRNRICVVG